MLVTDQSSYNDATAATAEHFGGNVVSNRYDQWVSPGSETFSDIQVDHMAYDLVDDLGVTILRYPGGNANEVDYADPNPTPVEGGPNLIGQDKFFQTVASMNADYGSNIQINYVLGMNYDDAFTTSAGQHLLLIDDSNGSEGYGITNREVNPDFVEMVAQYALDAAIAAAAAGVELHSFEIGNESNWAMPPMTSVEYALLASQVALAIVELFAEHPELEQPEILVESHIGRIGGQPSNASGSTFWVDENDPNLTVYTESAPGLTQVEWDWDEGLDPLVGNDQHFGHQGQNLAKIAIFNSTVSSVIPGLTAANAIDGITTHMYVDSGIDSIDVNGNHTDAIFERLAEWQEELNRGAGLDELQTYVTEWNMEADGDGQNHPDNTGLPNGQGLVELMFEMLKHGITGAQVWPLVHNNSTVGTALTNPDATVDGENTHHLSIVGTAFAMMSESLYDLAPIFDFDTGAVSIGGTSTNFDVHGFGNSNRLVAFASERAGNLIQNGQFSLDFANFIDDGASYFVTMTQLHTADKNPEGAGKFPHVEFTDGTVITGAEVDLIGSNGAFDTIEDYSITRIEMTKITAGADLLEGRGGNDSVYGAGGNDTIIGGGGDDTLLGGYGFDTIEGGEGDDWIDGEQHADRLYGGAGDDTLIGGQGTDHLLGGEGNDSLNAGSEADRVWGGDGNDIIRAGSNFGESVDGIWGEAGNDTLYGDAGYDLLSGGTGDDQLYGGDQADNLYGDAGNDSLYGGQGLDRMFGGDGDNYLEDTLDNNGFFGEGGNDTMIAGTGNDRFFGGSGNDSISAGGGNDSIYGGSGFDTINGGAGNDEMRGDFNADTFVFEDGHGADTILDFDTNTNLEQIDLSGVSAISNVSDLNLGSAASGAATQVGADVVIDTGGGNSIRLTGVNIADLEAGDFIF